MNPPAANSSKNVLNSDVELKGTVKFAGELTFDGKLDGDIQSDGSLNLGDNSVINGNVNVNFVDTVRSAQPEKISLRLEEVSFFDVLGYVCELSHSTFSVQRHAIVTSSTRIPDREK